MKEASSSSGENKAQQPSQNQKQGTVPQSAAAVNKLKESDLPPRINPRLKLNFFADTQQPKISKLAKEIRNATDEATRLQVLKIFEECEVAFAECAKIGTLDTRAEAFAITILYQHASWGDEGFLALLWVAAGVKAGLLHKSPAEKFPHLVKFTDAVRQTELPHETFATIFRAIPVPVFEWIRTGANVDEDRIARFIENGAALHGSVKLAAMKALAAALEKWSKKFAKKPEPKVDPTKKDIDSETDESSSSDSDDPFGDLNVGRANINATKQVEKPAKPSGKRVKKEDEKQDAKRRRERTEVTNTNPQPRLEEDDALECRIVKEVMQQTNSTINAMFNKFSNLMQQQQQQAGVNWGPSTKHVKMRSKSEDEDDDEPKAKTNDIEILLKVEVTTECLVNGSKKSAIELQFDNKCLDIVRPYSMSFTQAVDFLYSEGKGPLIENARSLLEIIPEHSRQDRKWAVVVIASSGLDIATIACAQWKTEDVKKARGAATNAHVRHALGELQHAIPSQLLPASRALFYPAKADEKFAKVIIEKIGVGLLHASSRGEAPVMITEPVKLFAHIVYMLTAKFHKVDLRWKLTEITTGAIVEVERTCGQKRSKIVLSFIEEAADELIRMQKPLSNEDAPSFLTETVRKIAQVEDLYCGEAGNAKGDRPIGLNDLPAAIAKALKAKGVLKGKGDKYGKGGGNDGGKGDKYGKGGKQNKASFTQVLGALRRYTIAKSDNNNDQWPALSMIKCTFSSKQNGCDFQYTNDTSKRCQMVHESGEAFQIRLQMGNVDQILDAYRRWLGTRGYTLKEAYPRPPPKGRDQKRRQ